MVCNIIQTIYCTSFFSPKYIWKCFQTIYQSLAVQHQLLGKTVSNLPALLPIQQQREQQIESVRMKLNNRNFNI